MRVIRDGVVTFPMTPTIYKNAIAAITEALEGRVLEAYVFGSAGTDHMTIDSDIDLILVVGGPADPFFPHRPLTFKDLYDVHPNLDILVYTPGELAAKLEDSTPGFWNSAKESMRRII